MSEGQQDRRASPLPRLRRGVVIAAFEGWNDAGDAATDAVERLELAWSAEPLAALEPDDYYDFQVNRPMVSLDEAGGRRIQWPTTRLSVCRGGPAERDAVIIRGLEPNMRWRGFCSELTALMHEMGVETVVTLGALLADTPHTRPVPVTGMASTLQTATTLRLERSRYEGPTGIVGVFQEACADEGFEAVSFWAAVPHYVAQPPCPKATLALLRRVEDLLDTALPLDELAESATSWERTVDELAQEDSDVAEYVAGLERRHAEGDEGLAEVDLQTSGEELAKEFERYLRRRGGSGSA